MPPVANDPKKTIQLSFDPFEWPIESIVEALENCPRRCREGIMLETLCTACSDYISQLLKALQRTCPVCGGNCSVKVLCEEHE